MSFILFLVRFMEKGSKSAKSGQVQGIPSNNVGPCQGVACPRCGVAEREVWIASGTSRRSSKVYAAV